MTQKDNAIFQLPVMRTGMSSVSVPPRFSAITVNVPVWLTEAFSIVREVFPCSEYIITSFLGSMTLPWCFHFISGAGYPLTWTGKHNDVSRGNTRSLPALLKRSVGFSVTKVFVKKAVDFYRCVL